MSEFLRRFVFVLMFLSLCCGLLAQSPQGMLTGEVHDPQGAVVPAAKVVAKHAATNLTFDTETGATGTYVLPALPIGVYEVSVSHVGFRTLNRSGITVEVGQRLRLDLTLDVGQVAETVNVNAEVSRVQTDSSTLGTVVERKRIEDLPLNGRNIWTLLSLVAGAQPLNRDADGFADENMGGMATFRINGGVTRGNQVYVDGAVNTTVTKSDFTVAPAIDNVEEFRVETNNLKAEFGMTGGGVINLVTRGGGNAYHGTLYEFFRNDVLDARNAFATQLDPVTGRIKPVLRYNQFGGTFGGPVHIPKIYDGHNRTFFQLGYEQWKYRFSTIRKATVPTDTQLSGDFSQTFDATSRAIVPIYDPNTTWVNPNGAGYIRDLFPGNLVPRNRMDPLSLRVLPYMPHANVAPAVALTNELNYLSLASTPVDMGALNVRMDHRLTQSNNLMFRYTDNRSIRDDKGYGLGVSDSAARKDNRDNFNTTLNYTATISPRVLNDFRVSANRQRLDFLHPSSGGNWSEKLGFPSILPRGLFPGVSIESMLLIGGGNFGAGYRAQHTVSFVDAMTVVRGRHTFKFGVDHRFDQDNWANQANLSGLFTFTRGLTGDPQRAAGTGFGVATFLTGQVSGGQQNFQDTFSYAGWINSSYVQDDWRVSPRLFLNLGVRYDLLSGPRERFDRYTQFDPFAINPATRTAGVLKFAGRDVPSRFVDMDRNNFAPRVGFAYDISGRGKLVVRGGFGILYANPESHMIQENANNALGYSSSTTFTAAGLGPFAVFPFAVGPSYLQRPLGPGVGPEAYRGQTGLRYQNRNSPTPYAQQWNLTIQKELAAGWVASISYAGNRGVKLMGGDYDLNQFDPQYWSLGLKLSDAVANPFVGQIGTGALSTATVARSQVLRPLPDYIDIRTLGNMGASSNYHSVQLTVEKRYAHGLTMLLSFTGSKMIDDSTNNASGAAFGEYRIGAYNRRLDRSIDENDIPRRMTVSGVYELPVGRNKHWMSNAHGVTGALLAGWQTSGTFTWEQQGFPLKIRGANNATVSWPDLLFDPTLPGDERSVVRWFDTTAVRNPPDYVLGNIARTLPRTRGPGLNNLNLSAFKRFALTEKKKLEFRFETFNLLNKVNLNAPDVNFNPNRQGLSQNALFGRITSSLPARRIQLGLRLSF